MIKMDAGVIAALRAGTPLPDAKLEALHRFRNLEGKVLRAGPSRFKDRYTRH